MKIFTNMQEGFNSLFSKYKQQVYQNTNIWVGEDNRPKVDILLIGGGSASGTTTLANTLVKKINREFQETCPTGVAGVIGLDNYYKDRDESFLHTPDHLINHDHPEMIDVELLARHLLQLKSGARVEMPVYNFGDNDRPGYRESNLSLEFEPYPLIMVEGLFALDDRLQKLASDKVFVYSDEEISKQRRINRDKKERGKSKDLSIKKWYHSVLPMYKEHVFPRIVDSDYLIFNNEELSEDFF